MNYQNMLKCFFAFMALLSFHFSFSQSITVTGKVSDQQSGTAIASVNVNVKGTTSTVMTDNDGNYRIAANMGDVLLFTSSGYIAVELTVNSTSMDVSLKADVKTLDEIVTIGYGTVKRRDLTGSVFTVKSEDILRTPTFNAVEALQGRVPGVDLSRSSGNPGAGASIRVRGNRSFFGSNEPLFIIDGFQGGNASDLNPNDIETIEVLKDAAATAIYGSQGANGVFIITTKKGRAGKTKVSYDGYYGINGYTSYPKGRIGEDYIKFRREAYRTSGLWNSPADDAAIFPNVAEAEAVANGEWVDWYELLNRNGQQQSHSVSVQSGNDKTKVFFSVGHFKEEGMLRRSDFTRNSLRFNLDQTLAKWAKTGIQTQIGFFNLNSRVDPLSLVMQTSPLGKPYDANGNINVFPVAGSPNTLSPLSDERGDTIATNNTIRTNVLSNAYLELTPVKGLTFRSNFGVTMNFSRQGVYNSASSVAQRTTRLATSAQGTAFVRAFNWDNTVTYKKAFGDHDFTVTGIQSYIENHVDNLYATGNRQLLGSQLFYNLQATDPTSQRITTGYTLSNNLAFAGRVNYSFKGKYLLALSGRYDGASRLSAGNKWDFFPSVSVGWNVSSEDFMAPLTFVNNLKLRASYGVTGNYGIDVYGTQSNIVAASNMAFGDVQAAYFQFSPRIGNAGLRWEKTASTNIGIDFAFLNNRITGSADWYNARTTNVLFDRSLPFTSGVTSIYQNIGETLNKGIEIGITGKIVQRPSFSWDATATFTSNRERIVKLIDGRNIISTVTPETLSLLLNRPLVSYYSYQKLGIWQANESDKAALLKFGNTPFKPGDIKVADLNGDGIIDANNDRTYLGSPVPKFVLGLQNNFSYKGFDLGVYIFVRYGQIINAEFMGRYNPGGGGNGPANFDYWTPENPSNDFPRPKQGAQLIDYPAYQALNFIDGSYWKIKTLTLGYTIPKNTTAKVFASNIRLYATANNLFTKAKHHLLNNYDPERGGSESAPLSRQFVFGVNLDF
ncbi:MAG: TonB-dependent receptor [Chitinophagaceae bacterium]|nr:TonB-dependent receptor [Chitinophagaceae bacterium]